MPTTERYVFGPSTGTGPLQKQLRCSCATQSNERKPCQYHELTWSLTRGHIQKQLTKQKKKNKCLSRRNKHLAFGRKKTEGTDSMDTTTSTSAEQPSFSEKMSIFASGGSNGNSTILRPSAVSPPVLSKAPRIQSWYSDDWMLSCGRMVPVRHGMFRREILKDYGQTSCFTTPVLVEWNTTCRA